MSTVELTDETLVAAQQEAAGRGVAVSEVVDEAVRQFVGGANLQRLIEEFRSDFERCLASP